MKDAIWAGVVAGLLMFVTIKVSPFLGLLATGVCIYLEGRGWYRA